MKILVKNILKSLKIDKQTNKLKEIETSVGSKNICRKIIFPLVYSKMNVRKVLCWIMLLIILTKLIFNMWIFLLVVNQRDLIPNPLCQTCSRVCGFWKCLTVNMETGDAYLKNSIAAVNNDIIREMKIVEFSINMLFVLLELVILILLGCADFKVQVGEEGRENTQVQQI